jgi:hypothetical protein
MEYYLSVGEAALCLPRAINDRPYKAVAVGGTNIFCSAKYIISEATSFIIHH